MIQTGDKILRTSDGTVGVPSDFLLCMLKISIIEIKKKYHQEIQNSVSLGLVLNPSVATD